MAALRYASGLRRLYTSLSRRPLCQTRRFATIKPLTSLFSPLDTFPERHIGPDDPEASFMLSKLGYDSMDAFIGEAVPHKIRVSTTSVDNKSIPVLSESQLHARAKVLGGQNISFKSYIGMGYHCAVVPSVILRNVGSVSPSHFAGIYICFRSWKTRNGIHHIHLTSPRLLKVLPNIYII